LDLLATQEELDDRHRRQGPLEVRVEHAQQGVGDLRELVVELVPDPRRQEREAFEQPLDVGVVTLVGLQVESTGDLGILLGELAAELPEVSQLTVVVGQQLVAHSPSPRTRNALVASCNIESNVTGSGAGWSRNIASMRNRIERSDAWASSGVTVTVWSRGSKRRIAASMARRICSRSPTLKRLDVDRSGRP